MYESRTRWSLSTVMDSDIAVVEKSSLRRHVWLRYAKCVSISVSKVSWQPTLRAPRDGDLYGFAAGRGDG